MSEHGYTSTSERPDPTRSWERPTPSQTIGFQPAKVGEVSGQPFAPAPVPGAPVLPPPDPAKVQPAMLDVLGYLSAVVATMADAIPSAHRLQPMLTQLRQRLGDALHHATPPPDKPAA